MDFCKPLEQRLYSKDEFARMNSTGLIAYYRKCSELNKIPATKIISQLPSRQMHLAHYGVGKEGAICLAEGLKVNSSIVTLDLEDNWIGVEGSVAVADALGQLGLAEGPNRTISLLDLSRHCLCFMHLKSGFRYFFFQMSLETTLD